MSEYNASDLKAIRRKAKEARQADDDRRLVVLNLMSSSSGRSYVHEQLVRCHCFASSYSPSALAMAFAEGERNAGLQLLNDVMAFAPDQYVQMMREQQDRRIAEDGRRDNPNGTNGRDPGLNGDDNGAGVDSDYTPDDRDPGYNDIGA